MAGRRRGHAFADENAVAIDLHPPPVEGGEGGSGERVSAPQIETGMVPGAEHRVAHDKTFAERPAIVRAGAGDCEHAVGATHQQNRFAAHMARSGARRGQVGQRQS